MRNLFLALVLANLGFAAWHQWYARHGAPSAHPTSTGAPIELVKEVGDRTAAAATASDAGTDSRAAAAPAPAGAPAADGAAEQAPDAAPNTGARAAKAPLAATAAAASAQPGPSAGATATAAAANRCVSVGPFRELTQAATASAKLREAGFEPSQRSGEGDVWVGYWVYLDQFAPKDADAMLAKLHANRVPDAYLIPDDAGAKISLGVFNQISRAGRLRDQVRALGFDPVVVDRTRHEDVYWLDVKLPAGQQLDLGGLATAGPENRLEQRACSETGGEK